MDFSEKVWIFVQTENIRKGGGGNVPETLEGVDIEYYLLKKIDERSIFDDLKDILDLKASIGSSIIGDKSKDPLFL